MGERKVIEESIEREGGKFSGKGEGNDGIDAEGGEEGEFEREVGEEGRSGWFEEIEGMV